jgi:hypothetical protein
MPLAGWLVKGQRVSFEEALHTAKSEGFFYRFPAAYLEAVMRHERVESQLVLSPSAAGKCSRLRLLELTEDYYTDPAFKWAAFVGSAVHKRLEGGSGIGELKLQLMLNVPLSFPHYKIVEIPLSGTLDHYDPEQRRLTDYKTTSRDFIEYDPVTKKRKARELPEPSHVIQTNLYRLLLETSGHSVDSIQVWYAKLDSGAARKVVSVPVMELEEIYYTAVELAVPLALAAETGELPECTCQYKSRIEPDLCKTVTEWSPEKLRAALMAAQEGQQ